MRASAIAAAVGGDFEGGDDPEITGVAPLDRAGPESLSFLAHRKYAAYVAGCRAGALLVHEPLRAEAGSDRPLIVVPDVYRALAIALSCLYPEPALETGVHATAVIENGVSLGQDVFIGAYAVVGANSRVGDRARIDAHCAVGAGCSIGESAVLHPQVVLYRGVRIGARSVVHAGSRLGVDGFGYTWAEGRHRKVPQVGGCVIGSDVEIGANVTIDRGSIGDTEIGDGVKIDNLVHIGHNVRVGEHTIIIAQVGVSGSTTIGRRATIAGQAGLPGHITIGDGATVAAQAGVFGDVPAGAVYSGYPARPHKESLRAQAGLFRLPRLAQRVRALERALFGMEGDEA
jgi:UDP-3-O-[3-hydroxymyristoyl] glucosamine N-acyltransferase